MSTTIRHTLVSLVVLAASCSAEIALVRADEFSPQQLELFEKQIRPLLVEHCLKCHGADHEKLKGGLDLSTRKSAISGGDSGPAVNLAKPGDSLLLEAVTHTAEGYKMPPKGKLSDKDIATLTKWVNDGLAYPADKIVGRPTPKGGYGPDAKNYWAYQPVKRPAAPEVRAKEWATSPVDAFVLARLEAKGLKPVAWFDSPSPLKSGWAWGQNYLDQGVAMAEGTYGQGTIYMFGPEITFRAQPAATFKLLFNSIVGDGRPNVVP